MFTRDTRISVALAARPELRQILPAFHPAFEKLNHPVLGRVLPRLVTVADAARIAGVDVEAMLAVMNLEGPPPVAPSAGVRRSDPMPPWLSAATVRELDVRPRLAAGEEPFSTILAALRALGPGEALAVVAPFEPAPLVRLLEKQGWAAHVAWDGDACRATFRHGGHLADDAPAGARLVRTEQGVTLDVRGLEPPNPMRLVLEAVADPANLPLRVLHEREPALLWPRLAERGLRWEVRHDGDLVEILIAT